MNDKLNAGALDLVPSLCTVASNVAGIYLLLEHLARKRIQRPFESSFRVLGSVRAGQRAADLRAAPGSLGESRVSHRYPLLIVLSLLVLLACAVGVWSEFTPAFNAPFTATLTDARTVTVQPLAGAALPDGLHPGDRLDLPAMDLSTRFLLLPMVNDDAMYPGVSRNYLLAVRRGEQRLTVPVTSVDLGTLPGVRFYARWTAGSYAFTVLVFTVLALVVLWRGRERTAWGLALWVVAMMCGIVAINVRLDGFTGVPLILASEVLFLLGRIGLYLMVDFLVSGALSVQVRWFWRGLFIAVLAAGAVPQIAGTALYLAAGHAGLLFRPWQAIWVVSFLIPVAMLFLSYRSAPLAERLRLRWMLWSGALWVIGIGIFDLRPFDFLTSNIIGSLGQVLGVVGFLYAVLRHRALDISVALNHTLVYGGVTALVVGVLAGLNTLLEHVALGSGASLLLQIVVPLALGIMLEQMRNYADKLVERVFFRRRYLAARALRRFAHHSRGFESAQELLRETAVIVSQKIGAPTVAVYQRKGGAYVATCQEGSPVYPEKLKADDPAFAAARSGQKNIDLSELHSGLGADGYVFPMGALAVLVCANRPGEHYAADERKLLAHVARQVGSALHSINMQDGLDFVRAVARGTLEPVAAREQALKLGVFVISCG